MTLMMMVMLIRKLKDLLSEVELCCTENTALGFPRWTLLSLLYLINSQGGDCDGDCDE